jgi:hypothetical protein
MRCIPTLIIMTVFTCFFNATRAFAAGRVYNCDDPLDKYNRRGIIYDTKSAQIEMASSRWESSVFCKKTSSPDRYDCWGWEGYYNPEYINFGTINFISGSPKSSLKVEFKIEWGTNKTWGCNFTQTDSSYVRSN